MPDITNSTLTKKAEKNPIGQKKVTASMVIHGLRGILSALEMSVEALLRHVATLQPLRDSQIRSTQMNGAWQTFLPSVLELIAALETYALNHGQWQGAADAFNEVQERTLNNLVSNVEASFWHHTVSDDGVDILDPSFVIERFIFDPRLKAAEEDFRLCAAGLQAMDAALKDVPTLLGLSRR